MVQKVSSSEFEQMVLKAQQPVLVDFFATWCGPCKMMAPTVEQVSEEVSGKASVYQVDVDESPDIAQQYGIMSVPTFIVFEDGQVKHQGIGAMPKASLMDLFN